MTQPHRRTKFICAAALLWLGGAFAPHAAAQDSEADQPRELPSDADVARIRADLQARQREREAAEDERGPLELETLSAIPMIPQSADASTLSKHPERLAWLDLNDEMNSFHALALVESADTSAGLRRVPLVVKGETWIALKPGAWRIRIVAGLADGRPDLDLPPIEARLSRGGAYRLSLDSEFERHLFEQRHQRQSISATPTPAPAMRAGQGGPVIHHVD